MDLEKIDEYVPQYSNQPNPITNLIHLPSGIFPLTGTKLFADEKESLYDKLKSHILWKTFSRYQKTKAKQFVKKKVKIIVYEFQEVERAIKHALNFR